jgi:hypothetical protein
VLGAHRDASDVVNEFALTADKRALDEWLGEAEAAAWSAGAAGGELPDTWQAYHQRALTELLEAAEALSGQAAQASP